MIVNDLYVLREGEPIDLNALRAAFLIATDSPRMAELIKRDMRAEPAFFTSQEEFDAAQSIAKMRREYYEKHSGVSVIIPCHNYAQYVIDALNSVCSQTRLPTEIIVVDDASGDSSREVIQKFITSHPDVPIRLISNPRNMDLAETQNIGIAAATQEHIVCLDADDMIESRYLETLHDALLTNRSLGVVYTGVKVWRDGMIYEPQDFPSFDWEFMTAVADPPNTCIPKPSMFRKDMWRRVGGFQQTYRAGEDVDFWLRGIASGWNALKVTPERLFVYRVHSAQQMSRARPFSRVDHYKPWMRDKMYPFLVPSRAPARLTDYTHPIVSVIIPVGPGHEPYLAGAIESVMGQTFRLWELIVVNDSGKPLDSHLLEPYPFARVIDGGGMGVAHARNVGIAQAHAPLLLFLDADDWLQPYTLGVMLKRYSLGDAGYVYGGWVPVNNGQIGNIEWGSDYVHDLRHAGGMYGGVTVLISTEHARLLQGFSDSSNGFEDWDFFIRCAINGICGARVSYPTFAYRLHTGTRRGLSNARRGEIEGIFKQRYGAYIRGETPMASCCGGNGDAILAAKAALGMIPPEPPIPSGDSIQMEYVGRYAAGVWYFNKYMGGNNPQDKFAHDGAGHYGVQREDVQRMLDTGQWRIADAPVQIAPEPKTKIAAAEAIEPLKGFDIFSSEVTITEPTAEQILEKLVAPDA